MTLGERIKLIRGTQAREVFAPIMKVSKNTLIAYEKDDRVPGADFLNKILDLYPDTSPAWLLTGEGSMKREVTGGHTANGNNIIQGAHIDADDVHLTVHQTGQVSEPGQLYGDPIDGLFLKDWKRLSEPGMMRVWTLLKEEIEKERDKREG